MSKFWKITLSVVSFFIVMLAASAIVEIYYGQPRPGFAQLLVIIVEAPILWLIWRDRRRAA